MDNEVKEEVKEEPKKKGNGLFTLFACVMTGVIVFLATNIGQKASKTVDPDTPKKSEVTSNVESNNTSNVESNTTSNVTSNVESNATSNTVADKIEVTLNKEAVDSAGNEFATVVATKNGAKVWEYTTGDYQASELSTFTLYEGATYVYLAENGKIKAFDKATGKVVWSNTTDNGRSVELLEVNGKLVATGYYTGLVTVIDVTTGTNVRSAKDANCSQASKIEKVSDTKVNITCFAGTVEYDITTGTSLKK